MAKDRARFAVWIFLSGTLLGLAAVLVGICWSLFVSPANVWSEPQALEFKAASDALHSARVQNPTGENAPEVLAAKQRFDRINAQLESARYAHDSWGHWVSAAGVAVILLCGAGYLATRRRAD